MKFISLFSGIGGLDVGLERVGMSCVAQVEIDPFCRAVLEKHWPDVPRFSDVRDFNRRSIPGDVDLVCGGFPCQDISVAGKGKGIAKGTRSGLWREMFRIIRQFRPRWVLAENVPALRTRGYDRVHDALERIGYAVRPLVVGAWAVGAPHKRDRVWIVADRECVGREWREGLACRVLADRKDAGRVEGDGESAGEGVDVVADPSECVRTPRTGLRRDGEPRGRRELAGPCEGMAHAERDGAEGRRRGDVAAGVAGPGGASLAKNSHAWPLPPGPEQWEWEAARLAQLPVGGAVDGIPVRLLRAANRNALKAYGNSVVPQIPEAIGRAILAAESEVA
jgi:DNA (cytosine-5)-methyltransferase 1